MSGITVALQNANIQKKHFGSELLELSFHAGLKGVHPTIRASNSFMRASNASNRASILAQFKSLISLSCP